MRNMRYEAVWPHSVTSDVSRHVCRTPAAAPSVMGGSEEATAASVTMTSPGPGVGLIMQPGQCLLNPRLRCL